LLPILGQHIRIDRDPGIERLPDQLIAPGRAVPERIIRADAVITSAAGQPTNID
jgi:hypothetical protein